MLAVIGFGNCFQYTLLFRMWVEQDVQKVFFFKEKIIICKTYYYSVLYGINVLLVLFIGRNVIDSIIK